MTDFANLPAVADLASALESFSAGSTLGAREVYLKMDKTGHWVYGADQTEIEPDSLWAINPFSFVVGYVCWGAQNTPNMGKLLGEVMVALGKEKPAMPEDIPDSNGWEEQVGISLQCISGNDKGLAARFSTKTKGGVPEVKRIAYETGMNYKTNPLTPVPIVKLKSAHYNHTGGYGRIYNPVIEIVKFVSNDKEPTVEEVSEAPVRRRRG